MHLELVSLLRCPVAHADGWLVAAVNKAQERFIEDGILGCPTCGAEYAIRGGVTYMSVGDVGDLAQNASDSVIDEMALPRQLGQHSEIVNLAAMIGFANSGGTYALVGYGIDRVIALQQMLPAACLAINPPGVTNVAIQSIPIGVVITTATVPVAKAQLDGVAIAPHSEHLTASAVKALRPGGRLVAPASTVIPFGVHELARDRAFWVAERSPEASAPIALTRR